MDNIPTYRPWESRWSPANREAIEARRIASSDRARKRRAEREALKAAAHEAVLGDAAIAARREAAKAEAAALVALMRPPQRVYRVSH